MALTAGQRLAWELLAVVVVVTATVGGFVGHERQVGALNAAVQDDVTVMAALKKQAAAIAVVYKTDTLRLRHDSIHYDTTRMQVETWLHDTIPVPVPVVRAVVAAADTTIRACLAVKLDCEQGWANARAQVVTLTGELAKVKALQPTPWLPHVGVGVAAGINPQSKFDAVLGLTLGWTFR